MFPILWLWNKFLKNENLFLKKLENYFVVESTTIESLTYPYKLALSKWTYHKEQFCQYQFFFRKYCFRIRTCYEELIWSTDYPNVHIHTFWKCWSFIWRCFFPVSILKFSAATIRQFQYECIMFYESSFVVSACTLKLQGTDHNYLKKLLE